MEITETISLLDELLNKCKKSGKRLVHGESFDEWRVTAEDWNGEPVPACIIFNKDEPVAYEMEENIANYIAAIHNNLPALRQAALDGERYRKGAKILEDYLLSGTLPEDDCAALTLYRQAVEQKEV